MQTFEAKRNWRSSEDAIIALSKFGLAKVISVEKYHIIEEFVHFKHEPLTLEQIASLLKDIHSAPAIRGTLIHGDYSPTNTTLYLGKPCCFDYEYAHYGNPYIDIGRGVLRSCNSIANADTFFNIYCDKRPDNATLREGFIDFCNWQHEIRIEKGISYEDIPLKRKERLLTARNTFDDIYNAFTSRVEIR